MPVLQSREVNDRSYRRGLVLGFTMAEVMLLILFCLLLIAGSALKELDFTRRDPRLDAEDQDFVYLKVPKADVVFRPTAPPPDSTGTLVTLWPILEDTAKTSAAKVFDDLELLNLPEADIRRLADLVKLSNGDLQAVMNTFESADSQVGPIDASIVNRLELLLRTGLTTQNVLQLLSDSAVAGHNWPPIILLEETKDYRFDSGSSEVTDAFRQKLSEQVVPQIVSMLKKYNADIVEVIGHTDGVPVRRGTRSTLDEELGRYLQGNVDGKEVLSADNAGLGLARSAAVIQLLIGDKRLRDVRFVAGSSGQLVLPDGSLSFEPSSVGDPARRRLEVRIRCSELRCPQK